ncbi:hypothetical protein J4409_01445 [Candidatus Woesearchaeota archaeon]|nr:hypothetical protein [Candidatus Woesearchaeota archaeon]
MNPAQLNTMVEAKLKELAQETDNVKKSEFFQNYLDTMSKFWKYSWHNQMLIHCALPAATRVAGFKAWNSLGRYVKKGEKSIRILAPVVKDVDGQEEVVNYMPVSVFDVSQTEGKELPDIDIEVTGNDAEQLYEKLVWFCRSKGISFDLQKLGVNGLYGYSTGGKIVLAEDGSYNMKVNTLVHEIAHELLHYSEDGKKLSRNQKEIQAEATAYVVCKHLGLETKSFNYLALYDADYKKIMGNLSAVSVAAKEVIGFV